MREDEWMEVRVWRNFSHRNRLYSCFLFSSSVQALTEETRTINVSLFIFSQTQQCYSMRTLYIHEVQTTYPPPPNHPSKQCCPTFINNAWIHGFMNKPSCRLCAVLLEDMGWMSVQYVGHCLQQFEVQWVWVWIKGTDRRCPLACVQLNSLLVCGWDEFDFSVGVSIPLYATAKYHKPLMSSLRGSAYSWHCSSRVLH